MSTKPKTVFESYWLPSRDEIWNEFDCQKPIVEITDERILETEGYSIIRQGLMSSNKGVVYSAVHKVKGETIEMSVMVTLLELLPTVHRLHYKTHTLPLLRILCKMDKGQCIRHKSLIKVFDIFLTSQKSYIFLDRINNAVRLEAKLKEKTFKINEKLNVTCQIVEALNFLHCSGIAHLNVKIENFLIDKESQVRLVGLSRIYMFWNGKTQREVLYPKLIKKAFINKEYPKEVIAKNFDPTAVDVFSLGIVICKMFLKKNPFSKGPLNKKYCDIEKVWRSFCLSNSQLISFQPKNIVLLLDMIFINRASKRIRLPKLLKTGLLKQADEKSISDFAKLAKKINAKKPIKSVIDKSTNLKSTSVSVRNISKTAKEKSLAAKEKSTSMKDTKEEKTYSATNLTKSRTEFDKSTNEEGSISKTEFKSETNSSTKVLNKSLLINRKPKDSEKSINSFTRLIRSLTRFNITPNTTPTKETEEKSNSTKSLRHKSEGENQIIRIKTKLTTKKKLNIPSLSVGIQAKSRTQSETKLEEYDLNKLIAEAINRKLLNEKSICSNPSKTEETEKSEKEENELEKNSPITKVQSGVNASKSQIKSIQNSMEDIKPTKSKISQDKSKKTPFKKKSLKRTIEKSRSTSSNDKLKVERSQNSRTSKKKRKKSNTSKSKQKVESSQSIKSIKKSNPSKSKSKQIQNKSQKSASASVTQVSKNSSVASVQSQKTKSDKLKQNLKRIKVSYQDILKLYQGKIDKSEINRAADIEDTFNKESKLSTTVNSKSSTKKLKGRFII